MHNGTMGDSIWQKKKDASVIVEVASCSRSVKGMYCTGGLGVALKYGQELRKLIWVYNDYY